MEQLAIPGGGADAVIGRVLARPVPDAVHLVGIAGAVDAAAFGHRLAHGDHPLAEPLAIALGTARRDGEAEASDDQNGERKARVR